MGGVSGHAGLFAPVDDLNTFAMALLRTRTHPVLSAEAIAMMTTLHATNGSDTRGLGWRLRPSGWGRWPSGTFWHTGFTGTSILVSPRADTAVVLLANFVHPARRPDEAGLLRTRLHRAVLRARLSF
jgi:CubicO group peptidase (beta-lactamase class C family)